MNTPQAAITGLILAGGRGSRMGGIDTGLQNFRGLPLALQTLMRLQLQSLPLQSLHPLSPQHPLSKRPHRHPLPKLLQSRLHPRNQK